MKGFSLIELMIGIVVGVVAMAATISAFNGIVRSNSDYLSMIRLNQELNAVMTLMTRDLKRAGYSGTATGVTSVNSFMNPYPTTVSGNNIYIGSASNYAGAAANDCLTFSYDSDSDGNVDIGSGGTPTNDADERFGYRHDSASNTVEMRQSGNTCAQGNWEDVTDPDQVNITSVAFDDQSISLPGSTSEEIRYISISISGQLADDPDVSRTLTERVRVRNTRP
nr:prepilin-type N-terminal cleavage/methylation domain-containing protein [Methylomarinum sp. Ch1-1]MDP4522743.1 prepilin-type N-terminal cleavage/methylation domain-containing protein [Methylomarinum sp. Ch1-1]